jgi:hypothetical protein
MTPDDAEWQGFLTWNDRVVRTEEGGEERFALDELVAMMPARLRRVVWLCSLDEAWLTLLLVGLVVARL